MNDKRNKKDQNEGNPALKNLRQRAEDVMKGDPLDMGHLSAKDFELVLHELQVHQVELHLQNEELRRVQLELETSRDNFENLYDFAPICYCTLDQKEIIREANQMCVEIFGIETGKLIGQRLTRFIHQEDQDQFYLYYQAVLKKQGRQVSELRIVAIDGTVHHVQIHSMTGSRDGNPQVRMILFDVTERKNMERDLLESEMNQGQRIRELNALHEATNSLLFTLDTETLLSRILEACLRAITAAKIGVIHLTSSPPRLSQVSSFALSSDIQIELTFPSRDRYVRKVISSRQRLLLNEIKPRAISNPNALQDGLVTRSAMIVPLQVDNQVYGAISLEAPEKNAFSELEMDLLESFAATATAAIRNARLHEQLQQTAITDFLTKVYNRQGFFELGEHEFQRFLRSGRPLSLIALDIDAFKEINDEFGHAVGDQVLYLLGRRLLSHLRKADILGRIGGDEFIILLPETDLTTGLKIARRLNQALIEIPLQVDDRSVRITISQGVAQATYEDDLNNLIKKADDSLYEAKAAGRNRIKTAKI